MALSMNQVPALFGMGASEAAVVAEAGGGTAGIVTSIISGVVGPLASAGASIYSTHEESKIAKKEIAQRAIEAANAQVLAREQLKVMERNQVLSQVSSLRQSQARQVALARYAPYLAAVAGLAGLALLVSAVGRSRRGG